MLFVLAFIWHTVCFALPSQMGIWCCDFYSLFCNVSFWEEIEQIFRQAKVNFNLDNYLEESLKIIPEILILISICVFSIFGLVYERSKNLPQVSRAITNMSLVILSFTLFYLTFFLHKFFFEISLFNFKVAYPLLKQGHFAWLVKTLCTLLVTLGLALAKSYQQFQKFYYFELPILKLVVLLGSFLVVLANDLMIFYLGVELVSLSFYILIGSKKNEQECVEAAVKYFVLSSIASALIIMGSSIMYSIYGTTDFEKLMELHIMRPAHTYNKYRFGSILLLIGVFYKLAVFPFHYWVGDVYAGSPAPVMMLMSTIGKLPLVFFLVKYTSSVIKASYLFIYAYFLLGTFSVLFGSFYAYSQTNVKRLLAYGSIVHSGFILIAIGTYSKFGNTAAITYSFIYSLNILAFFAFFLSIYIGVKRKMLIETSQYYGLFQDRPKLGFMISLIFFSFMAIPPFVGFFGKFFILLSVPKIIPYVFITFLALVSGIGSFYYFRVVASIFFFKRSFFYSEPIMSWKKDNLSYTLFLILIIFLLFGAVIMSGLFNYIFRLTL